MLYYVGIYQNSIDNIATPWLLQTHDLFLFASTLHTASRPYSGDVISQLEQCEKRTALGCPVINVINKKTGNAHELSTVTPFKYVEGGPRQAQEVV